MAALASWEQFTDVCGKNVFYMKEDVLRHTPTTFVFPSNVTLFATLFMLNSCQPHELNLIRNVTVAQSIHRWQDIKQTPQRYHRISSDLLQSHTPSVPHSIRQQQSKPTNVTNEDRGRQQGQATKANEMFLRLQNHATRNTSDDIMCCCCTCQNHKSS